MTKRRQERKDGDLHDLVQMLAGLRNEDEVDDMLAALLTPNERQEIALRWKLVRMLEAGLTQRAISEKLGVSLCKITRGSRELKAGRPGFRRVVCRNMAQKTEVRRQKSEDQKIE